MKVLVTGGAGFVGANLVRKLIESGSEVVVLDDFSSGLSGNLEGLDTHVVEGSVLDEKLLAQVTSDVSAIVHLAAKPSVPRSIEHPFATHEANATGTVRVLEAARQRDGIHVLFASSSSVYGPSESLQKSEDLVTRPISPYAASKLAAESYALAWSHSYGIPILAFRFFNVFGPLQPPLHSYAAAVPAFLAAAFQNLPLPVYGDGKQTRDFTYVQSVVSVLIDALQRGVTSTEPVNLAFGSTFSLLDVIMELEKILGRSLPVEFFPERPGDVKHSRANPKRLQELFPNIKPDSFPEGLQHTVEWFEKNRPWDKSGVL